MSSQAYRQKGGIMQWKAAYDWGKLKPRLFASKAE